MPEGTPHPLVIAVDVGGTFTDVVVVGPTGVKSWKTPTSVPQSDAVIATVGKSHIDDETLFLHGTTVATNALLESAGANVTLVTTSGFEDLLEIGRQNRPSLYDLSANRPRPLVARQNRLGYDGNVTLLDDIAASEPEAVAVVLIDSYIDANEECALADSIVARFPDVPVSVGADVSPGFREYERLEATAIDAYLSPPVGRYLRTIDRGIRSPHKFVMTSAGGLLPLIAAPTSVGQLTLSGPAAGVVAVEALSKYHGVGAAIAFDMGGTSTDVCRVGDTGMPSATSQVIGGRVNRVPSIPIHTVGAGGGSLAWVDAGGSLRVGPQSAGAIPGPASYGLGGEQPTVTDANVFLGNIPFDRPLGGGLRLDADRAGEALGRVGARLRLSHEETARGILEIVDAHMERAIRVVSVEEGFDPRESVLVAYGGAGGLHASRLARRLAMKSVLIPPHAGAFSALGLCLARPRLETSRTVLCRSDDPKVGSVVDEMGSEVTSDFIRVHSVEPTRVDILVDGRYQGQAHEITFSYRQGHIAADFADSHHTRYGFTLEGTEIEVVNLRAVATGVAPLRWPVSVAEQNVEDTESDNAGVRSRAGLGPGTTVNGPLIVIDELSTTLVAPDEQLSVLEDGTLKITW